MRCKRSSLILCCSAIVFCWTTGGFATSETDHEVEVMLTESESLLQFTCFQKVDDDASPCCAGIQELVRTGSLTGLLPVAADDIETCKRHLAKVPTSIPFASAKFSWSLSRQPVATGTVVRQWILSNSTLEERTPSSPFVRTATVDPSLQVESTLSDDGGMHRLLHHSISTTAPPQLGNTLFLFVTVTESMFVDIEDAISTANTTTKLLRLHTARVCDIEQPAFVSSQHVLVLELLPPYNEERSTSLFLVSTKIHFRYPATSTTSGQRHVWLNNLVAPQLVLLDESSKATTTTVTALERLPPVWVAAGNDRDFDLVMGTTLLACLVGVAWMLADLSAIAKWDP